jgi:hypothetical protein
VGDKGEKGKEMIGPNVVTSEKGVQDATEKNPSHLGYLVWRMLSMFLRRLGAKGVQRATKRALIDGGIVCNR